ncbi:rubrerythrin family protein [bacterium]|nr:rubrerythrin family protein [bacterium]MBU1984807.1 rubrerythrin family protein [bacterium]
MRRYHLAVLSCTFLLTAGAIAHASGAEPTRANQSEQRATTLDNLQMGYRAEINSHRRYLEYGKRADEEGYHQVASMFRAVARGEEIHAANIAAVIGKMGLTPEKDEEPLIVMSTRENLEFAAADQVYEKDTMYPAFIEQARKERNEAAVQVFSQALAAEPTHLAWYQQVLKDLDGDKGENVEFFVCSHCGKTARPLNEATCSVCSAPREGFEKVH